MSGKRTVNAFVDGVNVGDYGDSRAAGQAGSFYGSRNVTPVDEEGPRAKDESRGDFARPHGES